MIMWREGKYNATYGFLGNVRIFNLFYAEKGMYKLSCYFPGVEDRLVADRDIGKKDAEKLVQDYIKFLQDKTKPSPII